MRYTYSYQERIHPKALTTSEDLGQPAQKVRRLPWCAEGCVLELYENLFRDQ